MTTSQLCSIKILNKAYDIKCPPQEVNNLQLAATKLNSYIAQNKKRFRQLDDFQTLLLAALNISHELVMCQKQHEQQRQQINQFMTSLENKVQHITPQNSFAEE